MNPNQQITTGTTGGDVQQIKTTEGYAYPEWMIKFFQEVLDMRDAQDHYFGQPTNYKLKIAKARESIIDNKLNRLIAGGHIQHKAKPVDNQPTLFK